MDPVLNPFSPGAGSPPPALVGRESLLEKARILLGRVLNKKSEKSLMMVGLRGVGKTVLLIEVGKMAEISGYKVIHIEAHEGKSLAGLLIPHLRKIIFELDTMANLKEKGRRALGVLKSFINSVKVKMYEVELSLDILPLMGSADSGDLEIDLPDLFAAVSLAAQEYGVAIILLIDEIQYFNEKELSSLIMAMHKMQQHQYPFVFVGSGLPILTRLAGESKSYAERLFDFPEIGQLTKEDMEKAIKNPLNQEGVSIDYQALQLIWDKTQGYPYFIQEWGYQCWNHSNDKHISLEDVKSSSKDAIRRLDENFFKVRFDRMTPSEKKFLRAMASLGPDSQKTGDVASVLGVKVSSLGPMRANLMNKGMIYSPAYGELAFSVPLFDEYMRRMMPEFDDYGDDV